MTDFRSKGSSRDSQAVAGPMIWKDLSSASRLRADLASSGASDLLLEAPCTRTGSVQGTSGSTSFPLPHSAGPKLSKEPRPQGIACLQVSLCAVGPTGSVSTAGFWMEGVAVGGHLRDKGWRRWSWEESWGIERGRDAVDTQWGEQALGVPGPGAYLHPRQGQMLNAGIPREEGEAVLAWGEGLGGFRLNISLI